MLIQMGGSKLRKLLMMPLPGTKFLLRSFWDAITMMYPAPILLIGKPLIFTTVPALRLTWRSTMLSEMLLEEPLGYPCIMAAALVGEKSSMVALAWYSMALQNQKFVCDPCFSGMLTMGLPAEVGPVIKVLFLVPNKP